MMLKLAITRIDVPSPEVVFSRFEHYLELSKSAARPGEAGQRTDSQSGIERLYFLAWYTARVTL